MRKLLNLIIAVPVLRRWIQRLYVWYSKRVRLLPPPGITVELTYACNWRCKMCFHHRPEVHEKMNNTIRAKQREELNTAEIKSLIDNVAGCGVKHISLHGGEPLIRPDFCELVEHAFRKGLHTSTFTNATLITPSIADAFSKYMHCVGVSIHGNEAVHDAVTGIPGSYQKAMAGVRMMQEAKARNRSSIPQIRMTCVVSGLNYEHLTDMVDVARELKLKDFGFSMLTFTDEKAVDRTMKQMNDPAPQKDYLGDSLVSPDIIKVDPKRFFRAVVETRRHAKKFGINATMHQFNSEKEIALAFSDPFYRLGPSCSYPWMSSTISAYGDVYPCIQLSFLGFNMGNLRTRSFSEIWHGKEYTDFRKLFAKNRCYLPVCAKCCFVGDE